MSDSDSNLTGTTNAAWRQNVKKDIWVKIILGWGNIAWQKILFVKVLLQAIGNIPVYIN